MLSCRQHHENGALVAGVIRTPTSTENAFAVVHRTSRPSSPSVRAPEARFTAGLRRQTPVVEAKNCIRLARLDRVCTGSLPYTRRSGDACLR